MDILNPLSLPAHSQIAFRNFKIQTGLHRQPLASFSNLYINNKIITPIVNIPVIYTKTSPTWELLPLDNYLFSTIKNVTPGKSVHAKLRVIHAFT